MIKAVLVGLIAAFLLSGCAIGFLGGRHGEGMVIVPALPIMIEIDADQPYYQNGYYYSYRNNVWFYSASNRGPWAELPRDRYPREVHLRGHNEGNRRDQGHDNQDHDR